MHRLTSQRGAAAIDYLGILAVAAAIAVALAIAAPSFAQQIVCGIQNTLAKLGIAEPCAAGEAAGADVPCLLADSSGQIKLEITAFSIKGGGEVKVLTQEFAGGETRVTLSGAGKLGLATGGGGGLKLDTGNGKGAGGGAGAQGGPDINAELGGTWVFKSPEEAREFVDIIRNRARDTFLDRVLPPIGFINHVIGTDEDRPVGLPDIVYGQGGIGADAKGEAGAGTWSFGGAAVLGVRYDRRSGERTAYVQLNGTGEAGVGAILGISGQADLEGRLALTFDKHGKPIKASIIAKGAIDADLIALNGEIKGPKDLFEKIKGSAKGQRGGRIEIQGDLDLTNPDNLRALQGFGRNPLTGAAGLAAAVFDRGRFNARTYVTDRDKYGLSGDASAGLAFGFESSYETLDSDLADAWKWDRDGGFRRWVTCRR